MSLSDLIIERERLIASLEAEIADAKKRQDAIRSVIADVQRLILNESAGLDQKRIDTAERVIYVHGEYGPYGDDQSQLNSAVQDIANGCKVMATEFFGCKNFDRFRHQGSPHPYGYGPRHGSICFEIGMTRERRKALLEGGTLTQAEKDAAIYYLINLQAILEAKQQTVTA